MIWTIIAWVLVIIGDALAGISVWEAWFSQGPKAGLSCFFGLFTVLPLVLVAVIWLCLINGWGYAKYAGWFMIPVLIMIYEAWRMCHR